MTNEVNNKNCIEMRVKIALTYIYRVLKVAFECVDEADVGVIMRVIRELLACEAALCVIAVRRLLVLLLNSHIFSR